MEGCGKEGCKSCRHTVCTGKVPIFSGLLPEELEKISGLVSRKTYKKGETVFSEGDESGGLAIINSGRVKIFRYSADGREQILYILSEGDFLGEKDLFLQTAFPYSVNALTDCGVCTISRNDIASLLERYPGISIKIIRELLLRTEQIEHSLQYMSHEKADARIGALLSGFADKFGQKHPRGIMVDLPLSREGMASYIGAARETVSRRLSSLQEDGSIELIGNHKVLILKPEKLKINI